MFSSVSNPLSVSQSSLMLSKADGFIPVPCPTHLQYSVTNICKSEGCIEPLCPQCISDHIKLHQQTKKPAKIENIITTRITCIQQLAKLKYDGTQQLEQSMKNCTGNTLQFIQAQRNKLDIAKKKVQKIIDQLFKQMQNDLNVIANAFNQEKTKKQRETKQKVSPIFQYVQRVIQYKQQLQSEDYIPALIQLLNQPPRKPKISKIQPIENMGSVQINEKYLGEIKDVITKFVNVNINIKASKNKLNMDTSNYHNSNNMKFSRADRSQSKDIENSCVSKVSSRLCPQNVDSSTDINKRSRSNSRKKIFGAESVVSETNIDDQLSKQYRYRQY